MRHNCTLKGQNYLFSGEYVKFTCPITSLSWPRGISAKLNFNSEQPAPHPPHKPCLLLNLQILTTILFSGSAVFYWYIQPCWCEYMFISLSIIKIRKDSFDIVVWFPDMHCCQAKYLGGDIWHWNHPISERHLLFPYLRGSGYPPRRQIKSQTPVWFWITQDSQDEIEFISSKLWGCLRCLWLWWGGKNENLVCGQILWQLRWKVKVWDVFAFCEGLLPAWRRK